MKCKGWKPTNAYLKPRTLSEVLFTCTQLCSGSCVPSRFWKAIIQNKTLDHYLFQISFFLSTPVFFPGESRGQKSLAGYMGSCEPMGSQRVGHDWVTNTTATKVFLCCCSVAKLYPTLCSLMDCRTPGSSVLHYLLEIAQTHLGWFGVAI